MLDRLAKVMQSKRIDNEGEHLVRHGKVLSRTARKHQLHHITRENQRLLQRIQQVHPVIDNVEFDARAKKNKYMLKQLSDFKEVALPPQIEAWLLDKKQQLKAPKIMGSEEPVANRVIYSRDGTLRTSELPRSQSARRCTQVQSSNGQSCAEGCCGWHRDGVGTGRCNSAVPCRRKRSSKSRGLAHINPKKDCDNRGSPLRGRIRPKSGKL